MKSVNIRLTMMTDHVKNFVSLVNRYPYDMDLRSGRYVVDAKSFLGVYGLDFTKPLKVSYDGYNAQLEELLQQLTMAC